MHFAFVILLWLIQLTLGEEGGGSEMAITSNDINSKLKLHHRNIRNDKTRPITCLLSGSFLFQIFSNNMIKVFSIPATALMPMA